MPVIQDSLPKKYSSPNAGRIMSGNSQRSGRHFTSFSWRNIPKGWIFTYCPMKDWKRISELSWTSWSSFWAPSRWPTRLAIVSSRKGKARIIERNRKSTWNNITMKSCLIMWASWDSKHSRNSGFRQKRTNKNTIYLFNLCRINRFFVSPWKLTNQIFNAVLTLK